MIIRIGRPALALVSLALLLTHAQAADKHMGVATCASSVCHGNATEKPGAAILHSEYVIWGQHDPHANTWRTLRQDASKRIAEKLGIGAAESAPVCLSCHSDAVPRAEKGERHQLSDGVGCEACHGGAERWLRSHTERGTSHADNVNNGLVPLEDPQVLARVCSGCHAGSAERFAGHDIMGAGHPRLQFELTNYLSALPPHFVVDEDYRARKKSADETALWYAGQLAGAQALLEGFAGPRFAGTGLWPELAFFDCHACHQAMQPLDWEPRLGSSGLPPGSVRLNDSALIMVLLLAEGRDREAWQEMVRELHLASRDSPEAVRTAAGRLAGALEQLRRELSTRALSPVETDRLVREMVTYSRDRAFNDYLTAEQIVMSLNTLLPHVQNLEPGVTDAPMDALYRSLADQHRFRVEAFRRAMDRLAGVLKGR